MNVGMLRFLDQFELPFHTAGWNGAWPPPPEFYVLTGKHSGIVKVWPTDTPPTEDVLAALEHPSIQAQVFHLRNASQIPDEAAEGMTHVMRGAEYVYARPWSPGV